MLKYDWFMLIFTLCICVALALGITQAQADYIYGGRILHDSGFGVNGLGISHGWTIIDGKRVNYTVDEKMTPTRAIVEFQLPTAPNKTFYRQECTVVPTGIQELVGGYGKIPQE